jgi:sulfur-carrier protein
MAKILIPQPLRRITNDADSVQSDAPTLKDAIDRMESDFPGIKERLVDESGALRRFVNVYVNGEDVRFLQELQTPLAEKDEVSIVPAVAGG